MKRNDIRNLLLLPVTLLFIGGCEKEIKVDLPPAPEEIVVEAYINQLNPFLNYVILSTTVSYFEPVFTPPFIKGAKVQITEGEISGKDTIWGNPVFMKEFSDSMPGVYVNPFLYGKVGRVYKLVIDANYQHIEGITSIPTPVAIDSLHFDLTATPHDTFAQMTAHFFDPEARGNNYRLMYHRRADSTIYAWGDIWEGDMIRDDEFVNGRTWDIAYNRQFEAGDTVNYYLISLDRPAYNFWESYFALRNNNGNPFATPVKLRSNISNALGSFSGFAVSYRRAIVPKP